MILEFSIADCPLPGLVRITLPEISRTSIRGRLLNSWRGIVADRTVGKAGSKAGELHRPFPQGLRQIMGHWASSRRVWFVAGLVALGAREVQDDLVVFGIAFVLPWDQPPAIALM